MSDSAIIRHLTQLLNQYASSSEQVDFDEQLMASAQSPELQELCRAFQQVSEIHTKCFDALHQMGMGRLDFTLPADNSFYTPIKNLQSKLKHLVWQTHRLAEGDYNQHIDFLGEFSTSFNQLIQALRERQSIKQALLESNLKYDMIANHSRDVIWTLDIKTQRFTYISPSIFALRGLTVEEAMAETMMESLTPESYQIAIQSLPEAIKQIQTAPFTLWSSSELQQPCKDGRIIDVEINNSIILDDDGQPKEVLGISRDITARKNAQRALQESETKFKLIAENTHDVIWKIDLATFRYNYISPSVFAMRGLTVDEALQESVEESLTPESAQRAMATLHDYLSQTDYVNLYVCDEYQQKCKDGRIIDIELTASFLLDECGKPFEILGVTRDISARKTTERALKMSEARLAKLLTRQTIKSKKLANQLQYFYDHTTNAIAFFEIDDQTIRFTKCNSRWADGINRAPEELEDIDIETILDTETYHFCRKYISQTIASGQPIQDYVQWRGKHLEIVVIPIKEDLYGAFNQCAALIHDITDRVVAGQKIRESEHKFFNIFHNSSDAIVVLTPDMKILDVNKRFYELSGYPNMEIIPLQIDGFDKYIPRKYLSTISEYLNKVLPDAPPVSFECEMTLANESVIPIEINSTTYIDHGQTLILAMIRDISIRKEFERKLTQIGIQIETRERRTLATDLHDNVGPLLSSMNMYLSLLARKPELEPHIEMVGDIRKILKEAIVSVREISNNISPQVLTNYGLTSALQIFFETKQKLVQIHIKNTIGNLRFNEVKEVMVYNIIKELFNNTIKYAVASRIDLSLTQIDSKVLLHYRDNGRGFNLEQKLAEHSQNLGLFSIINRVKNLDGSYQMNATPGNGFCIDIEFPI